jgi:DNA-binding NarL/FixJ family response regulator
MVMQGASSHLTPREREVLELLCQGLADKQVADHLGIECVTVRTYVARLCEKLGARNRTQLGRLAPPRVTASSRNAG